jgi:hypothetical protein
LQARANSQGSIAAPDLRSPISDPHPHEFFNTIA